MKTNYPFLVVMLLSVQVAFSQTVDYSKIILPESIKAVSFEERLVQLAWKNNPVNSRLIQNVSMLEREKKETKWTWIDNVRITGNLNEFTIDRDNDALNRSAFFPRYNFGVQLSLGTFFLTPLRTKISHDRLIMGGLEVNEQKLKFRSDVLGIVEILKERYKVMRLRTTLMEDYLLLFRDAEKKFSRGEILMDEYRLTSQEYYTRAEFEITAQSEFNQAKILLESYVGLNLEEVDGYSEFIAALNQSMRVN